ncbi:hypothetical protein COL08_23010 [Priestia megaterium]|uniref:hypothetical protein n=1 Tax=Priestia megaterium TaxID=1404 RepID=UPI000BF5AD7E|nr:hypothetical protein [Priestia megaterium]PFV93065.1 hypothetical protein COL08_23010 [Priestia megaterium]
MSNEEIFRFLNVRPVQKINSERLQRNFALYSAIEKSPLHLALEKLEGDEVRDMANNLARERLAVNDDLEDLYILQEAVNKASHEKNVETARLEVERKLGNSLYRFLESSEAGRLKDILWDRFYAHILVPEEKPEDRETVYDGIRAFHFIELITQQKDYEKPLSIDELSDVRAILPIGLIPPIPPTTDDSHKKANQYMRDMDKIYNEFKVFNTAIEEIKKYEHLYSTQELPEIKKNRVIHLTENVESSRRKDSGDNLEISSEKVFQNSIVIPKLSPWVFEEFGIKNLSASTFELLSSLRSNHANELEVVELLQELEKKKYQLISKYFKNVSPDALRFIGSTSEFREMLNDVPVPGIRFSIEENSSDSESPASRGIKPLGIGDLLVLKQKLSRYSAGEVAHIENVLKSEYKKRIHSRIREQEEIIVTATENLEESEKDLQTTERFELQKEATNTIENQMNLKGGVSVTGSYGPVKITSHADYATSQSSVESNRNASMYAKEVTEKSINRIMRQTRETRTRRTLERFEEKNEHGFESSQKNVVGIYRWVDKYYNSKLINYGRRLMMEFIIPEPAAFYLYLQSDKIQSGIFMTKPKEPTIYGRPLSPSDLNHFNYLDLVSQYKAKDVEPYPSSMKYVSVAFAEKAGDGNTAYGKVDATLEVPPGYKCVDLHGLFGFGGDGGKDIEIFVSGKRILGGNHTPTAAIEGKIPISVWGNFKSFHVNLVASCSLKDSEIEAWRLKTYGSIMTAYEVALTDYYSQVNASQTQSGVQIQGRNPDFNRKIERDELRKGVLRLLTNNFAHTRVSGSWRSQEQFDSIRNGECGYPEFDVQEGIVEGKIIQFFEQAFEWDNITYRFYPYFWGRKSSWKDIFPLADTDPLFTDFLRAGAARVVIPVHPAFNETILHYLATNEIWNGGVPPTLNDPLYISIVDELKAESEEDLNDIPDCKCNRELEYPKYPCMVDEWEIKLPTTLVYLQEDSELPNCES